MQTLNVVYQDTFTWKYSKPIIEKMPYILVKVRSHHLTKGPTKVAMDYDKTVLENLRSFVVNRGSRNPPWEINEPPYMVLNRLEQMGYKVVAMTSNADEHNVHPNAMWTLSD